MTISTPTNGTSVDASQWPTEVTNHLNFYVPDPLNGYYFFSDFVSSVGTGGTGDNVVAVNTGTGTQSLVQANDTRNRVGVVRSATGSTSTGSAAVATGTNQIRLGGGTWNIDAAVNVTTLSTSSERFQLAIGFIDSNTTANQTDGAYFLYDEGGVSTGSAASANWQTVTCSNGSRTFTTTTTAVSAGSWVKLRLEVNAAGTQVLFKINGTTVATHIANIPTGSNRQCGFGWIIIKSVGSTSRTVDVDYFKVDAQFTSAR